MNRAIWIGCVVLVLQGCGDDGGNQTGDDAGVIDAAIDAPAMGVFECPTSGTPPTCGATMAPTTPATGASTCNPLTQAGCLAGEKCTWIKDQATPSIGHIGCAPDGTIPVGCACTIGTPGTTGYDDCVKGSGCISGVCRQICDEAGGAPVCATSHVCTGYLDYFSTGGTRVAGVCDVACDPLTQCTSIGQSTNACGSTTGTMPNRGCYGYAQYSCSPAASTTLALTDRMIPRSNSSGNPFLNGCAPGFIPFFYEMTGSTQTLCTGYCAALEIDNTPAHMGNTKGDATAPAKLPTKDKPYTGDGTCDAGKKGSDPSSTCKFIYPYLNDNTTGDTDPKFLATGLVDKLGVCQAISHFMYDSDNDQTPDTTFPACNTLPPRSAATSGTGDDAADFGCQKLSNSARVAPALADMRVGLRESIVLYRHTFE